MAYMVVIITPKVRKGRIIYYADVFEGGIQYNIAPIIKPEYSLLFLNYMQSLIGESIFFTKRTRKRTVKKDKRKEHVNVEEYKIVFEEPSMRIAWLYRLYLYGILWLRAKRKIEKLAKCLSEIDSLSPIIDDLNKLNQDIGFKSKESIRKMTMIVRGYCLVK